ncbi:hypothetical protein [Williamsoniiplasma lucivorax]|uniref:Uncharacterized protein n=1 Tax=Williamsoniiplasma lucivorax TaxID=209274 RepID=A0A2S5RF35_9MOLU|nr:hypothetical protein [Williamsoniiplasma lucivorax]PPE05924.1 hypothetical protein ELUCI_v1c02150 [Williamsoniiplasma lucivorax]
MNPEFLNLLKNIVDDEILIIKYSMYLPTHDLRIKGLFQEWDTNHDFKTLFTWLDQQVGDEPKSADELLDEKVVEFLNPRWTDIYIRMHTIIATILAFIKSYQTMRRTHNHKRLTEYQRAQITIARGITKVYTQGYEVLNKLEVPLFMQTELTTILEYFTNAKEQWLEYDWILDYTNEIYVYLALLIENFKNTKVQLNKKQKAQADNFIELLQYISTSFYLLLLLFEGLFNIEHKKMGIEVEEVYYARTFEKEEKLTKLRKWFLKQSQTKTN